MNAKNKSVVLECEHAGCSAKNVDGWGATLYTTSHGTFCAKHFTPERHETETPNA